jgi:hypothetical protein
VHVASDLGNFEIKQRRVHRTDAEAVVSRRLDELSRLSSEEVSSAAPLDWKMAAPPTPGCVARRRKTRLESAERRTTSKHDMGKSDRPLARSIGHVGLAFQRRDTI